MKYGKTGTKSTIKISESSWIFQRKREKTRRFQRKREKTGFLSCKGNSRHRLLDESAIQPTKTLLFLSVAFGVLFDQLVGV
jgi:hypothetical protein